MILARISVKQPVFATMVIAALIIFGLIAYTKLPVLMFPDIEFPVVTITTILPGADPRTVESKVTDVIENSVSTLEGIKTLGSYSYESVSQVFVQFEMEMDLDIVTQDVRDKIENAKSELPTDIEPPLVQKLDIMSMPILQIAISGNMTIRELTELIDKRMINRIEKIRGVGQVTIVGGRMRQIKVWLDADKLRGYGLTGSDVVGTLQAGNIEFPGGTIKSPREELIVKTQGEVSNVKDFSNLIITSIRGKPIKIGDVASVEDGEEDAETYSRLRGRQAVSLLISRRSDANELELSKRVREELAQLQEIYKDQVEIVVAQDNSTFTEDAVSDITTTLLWGGLFATLVILFFLRNISATIISALAIPVSIITTFSFMSLLDFSMNIISMMGLALSVGILIDDAIVVIENIFRHREMKESRYNAAINATTEIGLAVTAATLTIVAVFVPVAFMKGVAGQFFYQFGLTVAVAVLISLFISFTLTPMLSSRFLRRKHKKTAFDKKFESGFQKVEEFYRKSLNWALSHRAAVILISIVLIIAIMGLIASGLIKSEFMSSMERDEFSLNAELPLGSTVEQTDAKMREIESKLRKELPHLRYLFTTVGLGEGNRVESNKGTILIKLQPVEERDASLVELTQRTREILADVKGVKISTAEASTTSSGGFSGKNLQFSITGSNLGEIEKASNTMLDRLSRIDGFVDLDSSYRIGKPELDIEINREKAADLGVNVFSIASLVGTMVGGKHVTNFEEEGDQYEVWVRLQQSDRDEPSDLEKISVRNIRGELINLGTIVDYERGSGPAQIMRLDRRRRIQITSNLKDMPLGVAIDQIGRASGEILAGTDMEIKLGGEAQIMGETFRDLSFALLLAIIIIYMVLASQFASFVHPITIMIALPLSIIGAFLALLLTGKTLNIMSFIGVIMLMGIVTKNSILLIDLTNQFRRGGMERDKAIMKAGPIRLRPILMTALSTIFGVLPVALEWGKGAELRSPMAIAVIGGLFTSTVLTLIVIPVVYSILDDIREWRLFKWLTGFVRSDE